MDLRFSIIEMSHLESLLASEASLQRNFPQARGFPIGLNWPEQHDSVNDSKKPTIPCFLRNAAALILMFTNLQELRVP